MGLEIAVWTLSDVGNGQAHHQGRPVCRPPNHHRFPEGRNRIHMATDHAAVASAFGVKARRVTASRDLEGALEDLLHHDGPALLDIVTQPLEESAAPVSEWIA